MDWAFFDMFRLEGEGGGGRRMPPLLSSLFMVQLQRNFVKRLTIKAYEKKLHKINDLVDNGLVPDHVTFLNQVTYSGNLVQTEYSYLSNENQTKLP